MAKENLNRVTVSVEMKDKEKNYMKMKSLLSKVSKSAKKSKVKKGTKKQSVVSKEPIQLNDEVIVSFCLDLGCSLLPVDPYQIPRFKLQVNEINY